MSNVGHAKLGWHGTRKRSNGAYQARWCGSEGLDSLGGFISKTQAEAYALKMANEALNVQVGLAVLRKPIPDARQQFLDRRTKENTRALNTRRTDEFLAAMPEVKDTSHLTRNLIDRYALTLERAGHNPGGQEHHLKIIRAFCKFCLDQKWISDHPFSGFKMPKSDFQGRALSAEEWQKMVAPSVIANQHKDSDWWLNRAFRLGYSTILRISQIWKLSPADFRAPDQLRVLPIKGQDPVWLTLRPEAVAIIQELTPSAVIHGRYFHYWASVESMRNSVEDKARRVNLVGVRFHDVCKVTAISDLSDEGYGPGDLEHISNTSKRVLVDHYIKADRKRAFVRYGTYAGGKAALAPGQPGASYGPENGGFVVPKGVLESIDSSMEKVENVSNSRQVSAV